MTLFYEPRCMTCSPLAFYAQHLSSARKLVHTIPYYEVLETYYVLRHTYMRNSTEYRRDGYRRDHARRLGVPVPVLFLPLCACVLNIIINNHIHHNNIDNNIALPVQYLRKGRPQPSYSRCDALTPSRVRRKPNSFRVLVVRPWNLHYTHAANC
jgi:hypothetical protein